MKAFLNFGAHDRRRTSRVRLQCPVVLWDPDEGSLLQTNTENISCSGFYYSCPSSFDVGKRLEALLEVPGDCWPGNGDSRSLVLQCQVRVVRIVQKRRAAAFGVAVEIESFSVPVKNIRNGFMLSTERGARPELMQSR